MPLLAIEDLVVSFGAERPALAGVSLTVEAGEIVALLGPSGCGKTTTMRAVAGLVPVTAGRILLAGRDLTRVPPNKRGLGLVFQSYALFPHLSVADNIGFGLSIRREPPARIAARVREMVAMVGLEGLEARLPRALSGGQQQRVALARAVATAPELLLLDEPLSNLDARLRLDMRAELARIQRSSGISMLHVTHDQAEALALANRIIVMNAGRIEQTGTPEEVWSRPRTVFVARFMGFETILRVTGGHLAGDGGALGPVAWREGAHLAWRPRDVVVGTGPFAATVDDVSFQGETLQYGLATAAGPIKADVPADGPRHTPGTAVAFDLPLATAVEVAP